VPGKAGKRPTGRSPRLNRLKSLDQLSIKNKKEMQTASPFSSLKFS
jgi:hypothetical protein